MLLSPLLRSIARTRFARQAIADNADLSIFKGRPTVRLVVGLVLIALSFILGWPAVGAFAIAAIYLESPLVVVIGGPAIYGFSWLLWAAGVYCTGVESYGYGRAFARWAVRKLLEKYGELPASPPQ